MNPQLLSFTGLVTYYHPVLTRYARFITRNQEASIRLADKALASLWDYRIGIYKLEEARLFLKTSTRVLCHRWLHEQVHLLASLEKRHPIPNHPSF